MTQRNQHWEAFFARYGWALTTGDRSTIADCYAVPVLILSDDGSAPIAAREQIEAAFRGAAERYRAQGLVAVRPVLVASEAITERLVSADVHRDYLDGRGDSARQEGYRHDYRYVLRLDEEARPRIHVVIEVPAR